MSIVVTTLIENTSSAHKGLACEFGLSFHIKTENRSFLFDCGCSDALLGNAGKLNIDLESLDFVVCSHGHFDHCGGFRSIVEHSRFKRFLSGHGFFTPRYAREGMRQSYIGIDFDERFLAEKGIAREVCDDLMPIDDGCWLVGNIERNTSEERIPERFAVLRGGSFAQDEFLDEICLAVRFEDGLALIAGCSHPGIVNMAQTVKKRLGLPIRGVWGGAHLHAAAPDRIEFAITGLKQLGVRYFGLTHCSGDAILERIATDPEAKGCRLATGDSIRL